MYTCTQLTACLGRRWRADGTYVVVHVYYYGLASVRGGRGGGCVAVGGSVLPSRPCSSHGRRIFRPAADSSYLVTLRPAVRVEKPQQTGLMSAVDAWGTDGRLRRKRALRIPSGWPSKGRGGTVHAHLRRPKHPGKYARRVRSRRGAKLRGVHAQCLDLWCAKTAWYGSTFSAPRAWDTLHGPGLSQRQQAIVLRGQTAAHDDTQRRRERTLLWRNGVHLAQG